MREPISRRQFLDISLRAAWAAPLVGLAACDGDAAGSGGIRISGPTMGTSYSVVVPSPAAGSDLAGIKADIDTVLARIDGLMSTYRPDSELSRFNAARSTAWTAMSADTVAVIDEALRIGDLTGGAFDVTVGPLVALWGFGPATPRGRNPSDAAVAETLARIGFRNVETRAFPPALHKARPDIRIDLSGIAKGYAVDRIAGLLDDAGIADYLVEIGGELRGRGRNAKGGPWRIGIERPQPGGRSVQRIVRLDGAGLATSGDYRQFIERDGARFSHIIDPRTGRPVSHRLASVSVMADTAMTADALSTGLMVLGPDAGLALAERAGLAAFFIARDAEKGFVEFGTRAFGRYRMAAKGTPWQSS